MTTITLEPNGPPQLPAPNRVLSRSAESASGRGSGCWRLVRWPFLVLIFIVGVLFSNKVASVCSQPPTECGSAGQVEFIDIFNVAHNIQLLEMHLHGSWLSVVQWLTDMQRNLMGLTWPQANIPSGGKRRTFCIKKRHGQGVASKERDTVTLENLGYGVSNIDDRKCDTDGLFQQPGGIVRKRDGVNGDVTYPQFWPLREEERFVGNVGLVRYAPPLLPRKYRVDDGSGEYQELCNDGKGFITGHWMLGLVLCVIGIWCCIRGFQHVFYDDRFSSIFRAFGYQLLFVVFFGIGLYGVVSLTFQDCETIGIEMRRAQRLGFGGSSTRFQAGLSPTPVTHVSSSLPMIPDGRLSRVRFETAASFALSQGPSCLLGCLSRGRHTHSLLPFASWDSYLPGQRVFPGCHPAPAYCTGSTAMSTGPSLEKHYLLLPATTA